MPSKEEQPSDRPDFRPPSPDSRSAKFRDEFGLGGSGYKSLFDERKNPQPSRPRESLVDLVRGEDLSDPRLVSIAKTIDELVEARVAEKTIGLTAELKTARQTIKDVGGVAQTALSKLALAKAAQEWAEARVRDLEKENEQLKRGTSGPASLGWDPRGYYRMLGITDPSIVRRLTSAQIDKLFRAQADVYHPDHDGGSDDHMKKLSAARDYLKDPLNSRSYGR